MQATDSHTPEQWQVEPYAGENPYLQGQAVLTGSEGAYATVPTEFAEAVRALVEAARLAARYLNHPDIQSMPFAMPAAAATDRLVAALAPFEEVQ